MFTVACDDILEASLAKQGCQAGDGLDGDGLSFDGGDSCEVEEERWADSYLGGPGMVEVFECCESLVEVGQMDAVGYFIDGGQVGACGFADALCEPGADGEDAVGTLVSAGSAGLDAKAIEGCVFDVEISASRSNGHGDAEFFFSPHGCIAQGVAVEGEDEIEGGFFFKLVEVKCEYFRPPVLFWGAGVGMHRIGARRNGIWCFLCEDDGGVSSAGEVGRQGIGHFFGSADERQKRSCCQANAHRCQHLMQKGVSGREHVLAEFGEGVNGSQVVERGSAFCFEICDDLLQIGRQKDFGVEEGRVENLFSHFRPEVLAYPAGEAGAVIIIEIGQQTGFSQSR